MKDVQPVYDQIMKTVTAAWPHGVISQAVGKGEFYENAPAEVVAAVKRILASH